MTQPGPGLPTTDPQKPVPTATISLDAATSTLGVENLSRAAPRDKDTIEERREDARTLVAGIVGGAFLPVVAGSFAAVLFRGSASVDDVVKLVQAIMAPVIGIVGAVSGFYVSSASAARRERGERNPP